MALTGSLVRLLQVQLPRWGTRALSPRTGVSPTCSLLLGRSNDKKDRQALCPPPERFLCPSRLCQNRPMLVNFSLIHCLCPQKLRPHCQYGVSENQKLYADLNVVVIVTYSPAFQRDTGRFGIAVSVVAALIWRGTSRFHARTVCACVDGGVRSVCCPWDCCC